MVCVGSSCTVLHLHLHENQVLLSATRCICNKDALKPVKEVECICSADRKNDETDEYVANSLLYDRNHLPRSAPAPDCVTRPMEEQEQEQAQQTAQ